MKYKYRSLSARAETVERIIALGKYCELPIWQVLDLVLHIAGVPHLQINDKKRPFFLENVDKFKSILQEVAKNPDLLKVDDENDRGEDE